MEPKKISRPSEVIHPEWSRNAVIYEVNIRQYTPEGTFRAFGQHLPRLKEMGIDVLWLMPVNPIGITNRKGSLGSYYSIKDYVAVNPEYGTMDDFKALVRSAHDHGMKVIIDWVANHSAWDNPLVTLHPEWYVKDSAGKIIAPVADWTDVADLDYTQQGLRDFMTDALIFWVREADIDGFRCDVAGMVPVDFWNKAVPRIKKVKPVFMLAEWETPEMHDTAFDMTYDWEMFKVMKGIYKGEQTADRIDTILAHNAATFNDDAYRMRFTSNHDENSWNGTDTETFGDAVRTFAALTFVLPGMPLIYSGQEAGLNKRLSFFDKDTIDWHDSGFSSFYTTLIKLRTDNKALFSGTAGGELVKIGTADNKKIYAFTREKDENLVMCIFNLSPEPVEVKLTNIESTGEFEEVFSKDVVTFGKKSVLTLKPWEYRLYLKK